VNLQVGNNSLSEINNIVQKPRSW